MSKLNVIAIDGPAGSGKSTVAKEVARRLKLFYIDTGAMYRALTLKVIKSGADFDSEKKLVHISKDADIELKGTRDSMKVYLDKKDVSREIRTMEVTKMVKLLSPIKGVRENMVKLQRRLGKTAKGAVLEGRDIGTVVFPDAAFKFYLDADFEVRVQRRFDEFRSRGSDVTRKEVADDVKSRDESDMNRTVGPLKKAADAEVIDTTYMTVDHVVSRILEIVKAK